MIKRLLLSTTVIAGVGAVMASAAPMNAHAEEAASAASAATVGELVITGSRIRRTDFNAPAPVQIITAEEESDKGLFDATSILQNSTLAAGSVQLNNQFSGFVVNGGIGIESVSLRGLGAERTLVLLNGRRLNPAGVGGTVAAVDLNVIPSAMVDRYEILKDGASSIYGSDAIGGVVNIITKDNINGYIIQANAEVPEGGAGRAYDIAGIFGKVTDSWHIVGSVEYNNTGSIKVRDLPDGSCPPELQKLPNGTEYNFGRSYADGSPYCDFSQVDFYTDLLDGSTWIYDASQPAAFPYVPFQQTGFGAGTPRLTNIATDPRDADVDAISGSTQLSATFLGAIDISPTAEFYFEGLVTRRENKVDAYLPQFFPSDLDTIFAIAFGPFNLSQSFAQPVLGVPVQKFDVGVTAGRAVGGFRGDINFPRPGWKFDVYGTYGRSEGKYTTYPRLTSRVFNALDLVPAPAGFNPSLVRVSPLDGVGYTCAVNITNSAEGCYPLNWFTSSAAFATDPALAYITAEDTGVTKYSQILFSGHIDGPVFELPAGDVQMVLGGEYRHDKINDTPGPHAVARDYFGQSTTGVTAGSFDVWEGYAEVEAPLLRGQPMFESLTLNLSARYTSWETAGERWTYKGSLNWQVVPELRLRGTYGTSFRGPALFENYLASQIAFTGALDPCQNYGIDLDPSSTRYQNCAAEGLPPDFPGYSATPEVLISGALGRLEPETSKNLTVGAVWQPSFADVQIGVDYFHIKVNDQISRLGANNLLTLCYDSVEFRSGSPYCTFIAERDAVGDIAQIDDSYINIASQLTSGFDVTLRASKEFSFGEFIFDGQATYTLRDKVEFVPGTGFEDFNGTFGDPKLVFNTDLRFKRQDWTFLWSTDFIGPQEAYSLTGETEGGRYKLHQASQLYHSLSVKYEDEGNQWEAVVGVKNVFDKYPPFISANPYAAFAPRVGKYAAAYGNLQLQGRTFFVNIRKDF